MSTAEKRAYYAAHAEEIKAKVKERAAANPDKIKAYRAANREKRSAQSKAWREKNKVRVEEYSKEWRGKNAELIKQYSKEYYDSNKEKGILWRKQNPEKTKAIDKRFRESNKDKVYAKNAKRRAVLKGAVIEHVDPNFIYERDKGICQLCNNPVKRENMTLDHKTPLIRGGEHSENNVHLARRSCNSSKGIMTLEEYFLNKSS